MPQEYTSIEMLNKLVSFNTVSSESNLDMIMFIKDYLNSFGVDSYLVFDDYKTKANLFAQIGPNVEGGILLSGHTDVVPIEGQNWKTNPFKIVEKNNRLFGRGTSDMKGFNALILAAVPTLMETKLKKPIQIALSYDEEIGCLGAPRMIKEIQASLPKAAAVIVGEPTNMQIVDGHKTSVGVKTHVRGFEVHSSLMHTGVSAVMNASKLVSWLGEQTEKNKNMQPDDEDIQFDPPYSTLHVGTITGGTAGNITAKDCIFSLDIRCLPREDSKAWIEKYRNYVSIIEREMKAINQSAEIKVEVAHVVPGLKPEINCFAEQLVRSITRDNGTKKVSYGTEAGQFQKAGYSTIICGPGSIKQAHQPNEYIEMSQLHEGEKFVAGLIKSLC
ncbi:MAG: acetylornithine deacetylase [Rhodobacteraceae bacterium]|nr:MAG: acetylornithine deacetylase [Paracoccaceae bacterium]